MTIYEELGLEVDAGREEELAARADRMGPNEPEVPSLDENRVGDPLLR